MSEYYFDAMQLATALATSETLQSQNLPPVIFVASHADLLTAAAMENLPIDNPPDHRGG
jgi:hypothetical protein